MSRIQSEVRYRKCVIYSMKVQKLRMFNSKGYLIKIRLKRLVIKNCNLILTTELFDSNDYLFILVTN